MTGPAFSPKQRRVLTWWMPGSPDREKEAILCDGAVRSGKTLAMGLSFFLWAQASFNHQKFALCGKTIGSLRRNVLSELLPRLEQLGAVWKESRTENRVTVGFLGHENSFYIFGGRDESSASLIQGITLAGLLLDEAALMPKSFVEQACARCSVAESRLWFNCNPEGPEHWLYKEWILKAEEKNMLHLHFTMDDNPALTEHIRRRYENLYTGVFYRRFVLGQWCMAEGLVYEFDPQLHIAEPEKTGGRYYISVDYGTRNPFSAGLWQVMGGKAYRIREFYHNGRESGKMLTDEEYCDALEHLAKGLPVEQIVVDPSAASLIAALRRRALPVRKARNEVLPGIRLVATLLKAGILQFSPRCKDAIREFSLYRWEDNGEKDTVVKENDHAMDDIRYFCATILRRQVKEV